MFDILSLVFYLDGIDSTVNCNCGCGAAFFFRRNRRYIIFGYAEKLKMKKIIMGHGRVWPILMLLLIAAGCERQHAEIRLTAITVHPARHALPQGLIMQFKAVGTFSDNQNRDLTDSVFWSTSDAGIASIANAPGKNGLLKAIRSGTVSIIATEKAKGVSGTTSLTVSKPVMMRVNIEPPAAYIHLGQTQQFRAFGIYSDGMRSDITRSVTWFTPESGIPTVSNAKGSKGLSISPPKGTVTIAATDPETQLTGTAKLSLSASALSAVSVSPERLSLPRGAAYKFTATGIYADGSTNDISDLVVWAVSAPEIADIGNLPGEKGQLLAKAQGEVIIKATDPKYIISGSATLSVGPPQLACIQIQPPPSAPKAGQPLQLRVTGIFSDDSKSDFTGRVTWTSTHPSIATFEAGKKKGRLMPLAAGSTQIRADDPETGFASVLPLMVRPSEAPVAVRAPSKKPLVSGKGKTQNTPREAASENPPEIVAIEILPDPPQLTLGAYTTLVAQFRYADGTTQNITHRVLWRSGDAAVATIRDTAGAKGLVNSKAIGQTAIFVEDPATGRRGQTTLTVTPPRLSAIEIKSPTRHLRLGSRTAFSAIGSFSDGTARDVTGTVQWISSDSAVVAFEENGSEKGMALALTIGECNLAALDPETGVTAQIEVSARADW